MSRWYHQHGLAPEGQGQLAAVGDANPSEDGVIFQAVQAGREEQVHDQGDGVFRSCASQRWFSRTNDPGQEPAAVARPHGAAVEGVDEGPTFATDDRGM